MAIISRDEESLRQDLDELERLKKLSNRESVKLWLEERVRVVSGELERLQVSVADEALPKKVSPGIVEKTMYVSMGKFSWTQDSKKVKVYLDVELINISNILFDHDEDSFDMKLEDSKPPRRFYIKQLSGKIVDAVYKLKKANGRTHISITLTKKDTSKNWDTLVRTNEREARGNTKMTNPTLQKEESESSSYNDKNSNDDPSSNLMGLIRQIYQDGDDEMKRSIAKAWTQANDKKTSPLL